MTPWKQCLPDTVGLIHKCSHVDWLHTQDFQKFKPDKLPAQKRESGNKVPPITKKLVVVDTHRERKN